MPFEIPLDRFKFYHDWQHAPVGTILRVSDENGFALGVRCVYKEGPHEIPLVFVPKEDGTAPFLRSGEIHSGAVDVSSHFELSVSDPKIESFTAAHQNVYGIVLTTGTGHVFARGMFGPHRAFLILADPATASSWEVTMDAPNGSRIGGMICIRAKAPTND